MSDPTSSSEVIDLNAWPACKQCVRWSDDCEIAVALNENVVLLLPQLSFDALRSPALSGMPHWTKLTLATNLFYKSEWEPFPPRPEAVFSLGEEQSLSHVVSIGWSPRGLANHKRCALTVLTANSLLSLWASTTGDTGNEYAWQRVYVVNHSLPSLDGLHDPEADSETMCNAVRSQRIRSFSWGPVVVQDEDVRLSQRRTLKVATKRHLLAVSTDMGDILVLKVKSPFQKLDGSESKWSAEAIGRYQLANSPHTNPRLIDATLDALTASFATHLTWSSLMQHDSVTGRHRSVIACIVARVLHVIPLEIDSSKKISAVFMSGEKLAGTHNGPLRLIRNWEDASTNLLAFTSTKVLTYRLQWSVDGHLVKGVHSMPVKLAWNHAAGVGFTYQDRHNTSSLHIMPFLSYMKDQHNKTVWPNVDTQVAQQPEWSRVLAERKTKFADESELNGKALARCWGLDVSPSGHFTASCFSMHPSAMPEFSMRVDEISALCISPEVNGIKLMENPPMGALHFREMSSDTLLFSAVSACGPGSRVSDAVRRMPLNDSSRRYGDCIPDYLLQSNDNDRAIQNLRNLVDTQKQCLQYLATFFDEAYVHLHRSVLNIDLAIERRERKQAALAQGTDGTGVQPPKPKGSRKRKEVLNRIKAQWADNAEDDDSDPFDPALTNGMLTGPGGVRVPEGRKDLWKALSVMKRERPSLTHRERLVLRNFGLALHIPSARTEDEARSVDGHAAAGDSDELCVVCGEQISFEDPSWAVCSSGHSFARCSLTLLALQRDEPVRYCSLCHQPTLGVPQLLAGPDDADHANGTSGQDAAQLRLLELLAIAFEDCVFCGGKFFSE